MIGIFVVIACAIFLFWILQFFDLMKMRDIEFPGQHDKLIWAAVILVGSAPGALAFYMFKGSHLIPNRLPRPAPGEPDSLPPDTRSSLEDLRP